MHGEAVGDDARAGAAPAAHEAVGGQRFHGHRPHVSLHQDRQDVQSETFVGRIRDIDRHEAGLEGVGRLQDVRVGLPTPVPGEADVAHLALFLGLEHDVEHAGHADVRLVDGPQIMQLPQVDVVGLHPPQRAFEVAARGGGVFRHGLGENEHVLAVFRREEFPIALLAAAVLVELGRVKGADPAFHCRLDHGLRHALGRPPDVGAADRQHGHLQPGLAEGAQRQQGTEFVGGSQLHGAESAPRHEGGSGEQRKPLQKFTPRDGVARGHHKGSDTGVFVPWQSRIGCEQQ